MSKLRYSVAVSLDGFIAPPDGSADWLTPYLPGIDFAGLLAEFGGIVTGRTSFDHAVVMHGWGFEHLPTAVMTSRPIADAPANVTAFTDPPAALAYVRKVVERGDIWLFGGGLTATSFLQANLLDEIELAVMPELLGAGAPLFAAGANSKSLRLINAVTQPNAVQILRYQVMP